MLTFFSFIGFEDMLNVAEEVKEPERTMPWGIVLALAVATVLYISVAVTAVSVVDYRELADAGRPRFAQITNRPPRGCRRGRSTTSRCSPSPTPC